MVEVRNGNARSQWLTWAPRQGAVVKLRVPFLREARRDGFGSARARGFELKRTRPASRSPQLSVSTLVRRTLSGAQFSSVENGSDCFCTPQFHNQDKGGNVDATQHAKVVPSKFCSGLRKPSVYSMLHCLDTPPSMVQVTPAMSTSREKCSKHRVRQYVEASTTKSHFETKSPPTQKNTKQWKERHVEIPKTSVWLLSRDLPGSRRVAIPIRTPFTSRTIAAVLHYKSSIQI